MSSTTQYGLIILGNSGVGKSFLANILTGHDTFSHQFRATSVTHSTESVDVTIGSHTFTIFDIPGLIEAQQERIDLNKQEIDKAFTHRPNSIIMFVFGQQNGRIRGQDIVAFDAINAAYSFRPESLLLVFNGIPKSRPDDYEETTLTQLQKLLRNVTVNNGNLCFTDFINVNDTNEKQVLKNRLLPIVAKFAPRVHHKGPDIQTIVSELKKSENEIKIKQAELEAEREKHRQQVEEQKRIAAQQLADQQKRAQELRDKKRQQEELRVAEERRRAAECLAQKAELQRIRNQIAVAVSTVPAGQTHYSNVVLNGNTFHLYGTMQGFITGYGTIRLYNGSKLNGGVNGDAIDVITSGSVSIGGNLCCRNLTLG